MAPLGLVHFGLASPLARLYCLAPARQYPAPRQLQPKGRFTKGHLLALALYALTSLAFAWPLPARFTTALPGAATGDTGVYVWNLWLFRTELLEQRHLPLTTNRIFSSDTPADLSLHNYTIFANLLALPELPLMGPVAAYNLVWLVTAALTAWAMYLLARDVLREGDRLTAGHAGGEVRVAGHHGGARPSDWPAWLGAWLAGLLFAFSPTLTARSTEHLSLMNGAPLAIFVLTWLRALRTRRTLWGAAAGAATAWALYSDPYYGVYCLMLGGFFLVTERLEFRQCRPVQTVAARRWGRGIESLMAAVGAVWVWIAVSGGGSLRVADGLTISARTLYTPAMVLTVLAVVRLWLLVRPRVRLRGSGVLRCDVRLAAVAGSTLILVAFPLLWSIARRTFEGRYVAAPVLWRSSMPGVDLLAFLLPNPNHPLSGESSRRFLSALPGGFAENVASLSLVAAAVVLFAVWRRAATLPPRWVALGALFATLAAGPFVVVGTFNTGIPTPWTLARYLPIIGDARAPARFLPIVMMAVAVLLAVAVRGVLGRCFRFRPLLATLFTALIVFELDPAPRVLHSAEVPSIYHTIAADPRPVLVLELPFGVRDGLSSTGDFNASSQFYQTFHGKGLLGGYLSRVSPARHARFRRFSLRGALIKLSEGKDLEQEEIEGAMRARGSWRRRLGYVVVDRSRATPALRNFAIRVLDLEKVGESGPRELYRPRRRAAAGYAKLE